MPNDAMIELWNGDATAAWATHPDRYDRMLEPFGAAVLEAAGLESGARVLDVGCGAGALTLSAAGRVGPDGGVDGVDIARPLLDLARRRADADGCRNAEFHDLDAQTQRFPHEPYDRVISRFGVMFFDDPSTAFRNLRTATAPGGRLAFVCWQPLGRNEWAMVPVTAVLPHLGVPDAPPPDAPGPFAFGDLDRVRPILEGAGWHGVDATPLETALHLGGATTVEEAIAYYRDDAFGKILFAKGDPDARAAAEDALADALAGHLTDEGVRLGAATWIVTATAPS